jgi:hypothetical protein
VQVPTSKSFSLRDETFSHAETEDSSLAAFLGRPIRIKTYSWAVGGIGSFAVNPWTLFLENPNVVGRLNNYNLLRGDMRVKFVINGNSFYFGRAVASYRPLFQADAVYANSEFTSNTDIQLMALSQLPHIEIDSCSSQGGVLNCDYLYNQNYMSLPASDYVGMGTVKFRSYQNLQHANGGTDPITVTVFAWMENVQLHVPTTDSYQSGSLEPGPISKAASSAATYAQVLTDIPVIGPYAKATSEIASSVGKFARAFGFSRPNRNGVNLGITNRSVSSMACTNLDENVEKLALDAEQELTVDPRTMGLGPEDEMSLAFILRKESYLAQFIWNTSDTVDTMLFNALVTPTLGNDGTTVPFGSTIVGTTPMSHLSSLFRYWSGSIKFRFVVVASDFHKGRLRVTLDPRYNNTLGGTDWNTVYTRIIDLSKEREFEITANWAQPSSYALLSDISSIGHSDTLRYAGYSDETNGVLTVEVLNELSTPNVASTAISVMVYVSGGDDLRYMCPEDRIKDYTYVDGAYQSGVLDVDDVETKTEDEVAGIVDPSVQDKLSHVYGGESVLSIRSLLKRYWLVRGENRSAAGINDFRLMKWSFPDFPMTRGFLTGGIDTTSSAATYSYNRMNALTYLSPCYVARRGSVRYKYVFNNNYSGNVQRAIMVNRGEGKYDSSAYFTDVALADGFHSSSARRSSQGIISGSGMALSNANSNCTAEVELPFYSRYRFAFSRFIKDVEGNDADDTTRMYHSVSHVGSGSDGQNVYLAQYVATGEDFSLGMYLHSPAVIIAADPIAA